MGIVTFPGRSRKAAPSNLFFLLPIEEQHKRIRQLYRSRLTVAQISTICRMSVSAVEVVLAKEDGRE